MTPIYEEQNFDFDHYLGVEHNVSEDIDTLEVQFSEVRETLISLGVDLDANGTIQTPDPPVIPLPQTPRAKHPPSSVDFQDLTIEAGRYLSATGLDPNIDPLLQVLSPTQKSEINRRYKHAFGDIGWDQSDYLAVLLAGFVATLLDVFLVRIPPRRRLPGKDASRISHDPLDQGELQIRPRPLPERPPESRESPLRPLRRQTDSAPRFTD